MQKSIPGHERSEHKSGAPGAEGNNTRRDFVRLPARKPKRYAKKR